MTLTNFSDGNALTEEQLDDMNKAILTQNGLQLIETLTDRTVTYSKGQNAMIGEAYTVAAGQQGSVDTTNIINGTFDTDKYYPTDSSLNCEIPHNIPSGTFKDDISSGVFICKVADWEEEAGIDFKATSTDWTEINQNSYVQIEASIINQSELEINDCLIKKVSNGVWILGNTNTDDEIARAKIYQTLFYGSDGSDPAITSVLGLTSLKTSVSRDIGKRAHYANYSGGDDSGDDYNGTFLDTTNNTDCSSWAFASAATGDICTWELPSGTALLSVTGNVSGVSELGTDKSSDEYDNPADCKLGANDNSGSNIIKSLILCSGDITWSYVGSGAVSNTDFYSDYSVPEMTTTDSLPSGQSDSDWISGTYDGEYIKFPLENFTTAFTSEPTQYIVRLKPKSSSPTSGFPSIYGSAVLLE